MDEEQTRQFRSSWSGGAALFYFDPYVSLVKNYSCPTLSKTRTNRPYYGWQIGLNSGLLTRWNGL